MPSARYHWSAILNGERRELVAGIDFDVPTRSMQQMVRAAARARDLQNVRTKVTAKGDIVITYRARRHVRAYDWDAWLDGERHILQRGKDFEVDIESFRRMVYRAARNRGVGIRTRTRRVDGYQMFALKAVPKESS